MLGSVGARLVDMYPHIGEESVEAPRRRPEAVKKPKSAAFRPSSVRKGPYK